MSRFAPLLLVVLLVAGCAEEPAGDPRLAAAEAAARAIPVDVDDAHGAIRGTVLDTEGEPIAGAVVSINPAHVEAVTTAEGAFAVGGLEPRRYVVLVTATSHESFEEYTVVVAGEAQPALVHLVLPAIEVEARVETQEWDRQVSSTAMETGIITQGVAVTKVEEEGATVVQMEFTWDAQTPLTETLEAHMGYGLNGKTNIATTGTSPLVLRLNATIDGLPVEYACGWLEAIDQGGISLGYQQDYHVRIDTFFGFVPRADWTFGKDGPYPVPESA
jgi:hypothetical protein